MPPLGSAREDGESRRNYGGPAHITERCGHVTRPRGKGRYQTMTDKEIHERYMVPVEIIREYDSMVQSCGDGYDAAALRCMSKMMCLHGLNFSSDEVRKYMDLSSRPDEPCVEQLCTMLDKKRKDALDEIHTKEEQISRIDYLTQELVRQAREK